MKFGIGRPHQSRDPHGSTLTAIVGLEERLHLELSDVRVAPTQRLSAAARAWSQAVWAAAERAGPADLAQSTVTNGLERARRPVFVCGAHRSDTTLVRDLLYGHPALSVLPSEGMFFTSFEAKLRQRTPGEALRFMGDEWQRRLATSINQPPYWLLGRSTDSSSPYVMFARALEAWWPAIESRMGRYVSSWPLVSVALAYASCRHDFEVPASIERWVEKTPTNKRFLDRLWTEFPAAKIVHVVREPAAVFASRRTLEERSGGSFRHARRILRELALSYRVAAVRARSEPRDRYLLIRYEELIQDPRGVVPRLADFLGIDLLPILFTPTVAGMPSPANSSFAATGPRGRIVSGCDRTGEVLTTWDRDLIAATVGELAAAVGYAAPPIAPWRGRLLRLASQVH